MTASVGTYPCRNHVRGEEQRTETSPHGTTKPLGLYVHMDFPYTLAVSIIPINLVFQRAW
jgi:hypothetical protein